MGAILNYSGARLFVMVFAIYPFTAQLFREAAVEKSLPCLTEVDKKQLKNILIANGRDGNIRRYK